MEAGPFPAGNPRLMGSAQSLLAELRRRNVFRAAAIYAAAVWALAQGIAQLAPTVGLPDWATRWFLVAAIIGFPFWIALAWFYEFTPHGLKRESEITDRDPSVRRAAGRKLDFAIIGVLALAVVLLVTNQFVLRGDATSRAHTNALANIPAMSVAVLPLANASPDKDQVYFSDGLSEDLINTLSQFEHLKVISAHSSFQFRNTSASAQEVGAKLGVAHLVEGSVRHAGGMVRITAQLVNVADGSTLWSEHYDRPYKDLFALQDTVTKAIAYALKAKLQPGTQVGNKDRRPPGGNVDAYAAFLRGKVTANQATSEAEPEPGYLKAMAEFDSAIRIDPRYAAAVADKALVWMNLSTVRTGAARQQALANARELAAQAQALAPNNVVVLNALASLHGTFDHDLSKAVAEYRRAIQADPHAVFAKDNLAAVLLTLGQPQEAAALLHESLQIDPLNAIAYGGLSNALVAMGKLDAAAAAARKMIEVQPSSAAQVHGQLAMIEILRGNAAAALAEARQSPAAYGTRDANVALALQIGSDRAAADAALKALIARPPDDQMFGTVADVYALRKDADQVFAWLDRAMKNGENVAGSLLADPFLKPYWHDPRFAALCKQLGLPAPGDAVATP
jgi:TolB-like protein/Flp pilus assembly protein TadD